MKANAPYVDNGNGLRWISVGIASMTVFFWLHQWAVHKLTTVLEKLWSPRWPDIRLKMLLSKVPYNDSGRTGGSLLSPWAHILLCRGTGFHSQHPWCIAHKSVKHYFQGFRPSLWPVGLSISAWYIYRQVHQHIQIKNKWKCVKLKNNSFTFLQLRKALF